MKIAILGTGDVGKTLGTALIQLGHTVTMGSRTADNQSAHSWASEHDERASQGTFANAAANAEVILNCSAGQHSLSILASVKPKDLAGKVLIDVANPLDFSNGFPPRLSICNDDSLGEQIQRAHPDLRVVKAFNTMSNAIMAEPGKLSGSHQLLVCGNDSDAKAIVKDIALSFGWQESQWLDLGGIEQARGTEMYLALWVRLYGKLQTPMFNIAIARE
ncbi:NADPH-dependent F420 reductase [Saccharospirillum alexandrii]|uniref:NADPH-dependent F420 reductase n=1 Tax=Saccharospirillum alexandrii TaxID=2448477 RepID=UPI003736151A